MCTTFRLLRVDVLQAEPVGERVLLEEFPSVDLLVKPDADLVDHAPAVRAASHRARDLVLPVLGVWEREHAPRILVHELAVQERHAAARDVPARHENIRRVSAGVDDPARNRELAERPTHEPSSTVLGRPVVDLVQKQVELFLPESHRVLVVPIWGWATCFLWPGCSWNVSLMGSGPSSLRMCAPTHRAYRSVLPLGSPGADFRHALVVLRSAQTGRSSPVGVPCRPCPGSRASFFPVSRRKGLAKPPGFTIMGG